MDNDGPALALPARFASLAAPIERSVLGELLSEFRRLRLLDLAYTLSAQGFVALLPLVLVVTSAFSQTGSTAVAADQLIERFGLVGAAQTAMRQLFTTPGAGSGVYWTGLVVTLYSAFSLARRLGRAYADIWQVPRLPVGQQWRALVWILIQITAVVVVSGMRSFGREHGTAVAALVLAALLLLWAGAEFLAQWLLTAGSVPRERLAVAAGLVSLGKLGAAAWSVVYLPGLLSRQSLSFGPIGVVFSLFSWLFLVAFVLLLMTMLGAVLSGRPVRTWTGTTPTGTAPAGTQPA